MERSQKVSVMEEAWIHRLCYWGSFSGSGPQCFNSFNFFIVEQQKREDLYSSQCFMPHR